MFGIPSFCVAYGLVSDWCRVWSSEGCVRQGYGAYWSGYCCSIWWSHPCMLWLWTCVLSNVIRSTLWMTLLHLKVKQLKL